MANALDNVTPEQWSAAILPNLDRVNVALGVCANRDYEGFITKSGDTVHVHTLGNIATGSYTRGQDIDYTDVAPSKESLVIDRNQYAAWLEDDLDGAVEYIGVLEKYGMRAAVAFAEHFDNVLMSRYVDAHTSNRLSSGGSAYTLSTSNAYTLLVDARTQLTKRNAPMAGRWAIVSPDYTALLLKDTTYLQKATEMGDQIVKSGMLGETAAQAAERGFFGRVAGFDIWESNNVQSTATGFYHLFGQGKPISMAARLMPTSFESVRDPNTFESKRRGLALYGLKTFDESAKRLGYILGNV